MNLAFLTSTPLNVRGGSGTYIGISTLARSLRQMGVHVEIVSPTGEDRFAFNELLAERDFSRFDRVIGFDMDGYCLNVPHVAALKGVAADEAAFEPPGPERDELLRVAQCERENVHRCTKVLTTSAYSAQRARELYSLSSLPSVVPELIDLAAWRSLFAAEPHAGFRVLCVARPYARKRIPLLAASCAQLRRDAIPDLDLRMITSGDLSDRDLAREYKSCDLFCHPSVQEGFGIVFLEAMAAGKPILAVRAGAAPEVVPHAVFADPDDMASLANGILDLYRDRELRDRVAAEGLRRVEQFDAPGIARQFLGAID